jgi:hypothetical protein
MADAQTCEVGVTVVPTGICRKETDNVLFTQTT